VTDRDALYAAILTHPDEDTPRLALADWLEEHGDAKYATFIRTQIELAKVPEWDPLWIAAWERDRDALTGRGYTAFQPKLPDGLEWPALTAYRRGFPCHVESAGVAPFLKYADKLTAAAPIEAITIDGEEDWPAPPEKLGSLLNSLHMWRMKHLGLWLANVTRDAVRRLRTAPHAAKVKSLHVALSHLEPAAMRELFEPPLVNRLESLRLASCSGGWSGLSAVAKADGPYRLTSFVLDHNTAMSFSAKTLFNAPLLRGLREFEISGTELREKGVQLLCGSPVVNGLESLTLTKTKPGAVGVESLAECVALRSLKRLRLNMNRLGPAAIKLLAKSPHLAGLQALALENNPLGDRGAVALAESPCMANLVQLDLMGCDIGDAGAEAIMNALSADKLISLSLNARERLGLGVRRRLRKKFGDRVFI
jgi:uncharacterized protein (TIGR02996 family)